MVINALNCGAQTFMADLEDANCPTWDNMVSGQANLMDAARRTIDFEQSGKQYRLNEKTAVLIPRPRGWHLDEKHVRLDGQPVAGAPVRLRHQLLPQRERAPRARQRTLLLPAEDGVAPRGAPRGTTSSCSRSSARRAAGLGARHGADRDAARGLRDGRDPVGAARPFSRPQHRPLGLHLLVHQEAPLPPRVLPRRPLAGHHDRALHARLCAAAGEDLPSPQAPAMGGMAAQIPIKNDPAANEAAMAKVRADKEREATDGCDGTWVAHSGLVPIAKEVFDQHMPGPTSTRSSART
jgi:malate synthase